MPTVPVSVVIPCYRSAATVARAVRSVRRQTAVPAEVILVDDASDDATPDLLAALQAQHGGDWLKLVTLDRNRGAAAARNRGWAVATQPHLAFLDSDDSWHPRKVELQLGWMQAHPEVGLTGHKYVWMQDAPEDAAWPIDDRPPLPARPVTVRELMLFSPFSTPSVMLRTGLPFRFDEGKRRAEDRLLWLEVAAFGPPSWVIELPLCRLHKAPWGEDGLSRSNARMWVESIDYIWKMRRSGGVSAGLALHAALKTTAHHAIRQTFGRPSAGRSPAPDRPLTAAGPQEEPR
jgi:glycosyltransferase involved in cell wall biosynthesis